MMHQEILQRAIEIAKDAGRLALEHFNNRDKLTIDNKGYLDFVSEADCNVEAFIKSQLLAAFPNHGFKGEESGGAFAPPCWVIDPIDGTTNFLYGRPDFCISMGFVDEAGPAIGIVHAPVHGRTVYAVRGQGAFEDGKPLQPREASDTELVINLTFNYKTGNADDFLKKVNMIVANKYQIRDCGSAAWALCQAAMGQVDGAYNGNVNIWDALAGLLICKEAGLEARDFFEEKGSMYAYPKGSPLKDILVPMF
ncbi:inositol monophosphatase family protein [Pseudovibrio flavus]|uniref:inositol monophosphatase family protein n=1 Tax=Pseudovibrio flavus TaxID=2529854 RepID=UPI00211B7E74|nr:inositol monophosphatase family protein [Pseudovibrio flavus]